MFKNQRPIFLCALLLLALLVSSGAQWAALAQSEAPRASTLEAAFQAALEAYQKEQGDGTLYQMGEIHAEKEWAYVTAQETANGTAEELGRYVVLLARQVDEKSWLALAPTSPDLEAYNQWLKEFPASLIDAATQDYLYQYPRGASLTSTFTGQRLPWPAARPGYASNRDGANHTNQVDFTTSDTDAVYATKPGKVVFVKESSNTNCTQAPPDSCWEKANVVVIQHSANEYSWYFHLAYNAVVVELNSYVEFGTKIATEGYTGYTYPANFKHLHYMVSSSVPTWPNPADPNRAPWPPAGSLGTVDFDEATWSQLGGNLTSQNTSDPAAVSWGSGRVDLFVQGEDNQLWHTSNANWTTWEPLQGILTSAPDAASWGSGHLDVYVRGLNNRLYYRRYLNNAWLPLWYAVPELNGGVTSNPSAVSWGYGRIDLFARGSDNALWHISYTYSNDTWSAWEPLYGTLVGGPDAASLGSGSLNVYVRGTDNGVWFKRYRNGTWTTTWENVPEAIVTADPGVAASYSNQIDLFVRGVTKVLWHRPYTTGWGAWDPMDGTLISGPDAASWRSGHLDVFVRGTDNHIYHRWKTNGGSWSGWGRVDKPNP